MLASHARMRDTISSADVGTWVGKGPRHAGPCAESSAQDKTPARDNEVHRRTPLALAEEKESRGQKRRRGETAHGVVVRPATEGSAQAYGRPR